MIIVTRAAGDPTTEFACYTSNLAAQAGHEAVAAKLEILRTETRDKKFRAAEARGEQNQPLI